MSVTMREMLEAGVHFGHQTRFWNPKMSPFIFGHRNKIHIINLEKSLPMFQDALKFVKQLSANRGNILMVGTKRQARDTVAAEAQRAGVPYVDQRWLGGMLTNWKAVSGSIKTMNELEETLAREDIGLTKKEQLKLTRRRDKIDRALGGIREMGGLPDILVVIDTNKEDIAVHEARKLGIPVIAIVDSNSNPDPISMPIPGNDDAMRAITLYCDLFARAVIDGLQQEIAASGVDVGAAEVGLTETVPEVDPVAAEVAATGVEATEAVTEPAPEAAAEAATPVAADTKA